MDLGTVNYGIDMSQANTTVEKKRKKKELKVGPFLLGADPEFALVGTNGKAVDAVLYVKREGEKVGFEGPMLELHPDPAATAYKLCQNIRELLLSPVLAKAREKTAFRAGAVVLFDDLGEETYHESFSEPMGGHIHFDRRGWPEWGGRNTYGEHMPTVRKPPFVSTLHCLTNLLEHLDILPKEESKKRRRDGYGVLRDAFRTDREETFEYRKMCSWLFRPHIAFLCLTAAKLVAAHPEVAKEVLGTARTKLFPNGYGQLCKFVGAFASKDQDALRLTEMVLDLGLKKVQADHTENFLPYWQKWEPEETKEALCGS